MEPINGTGYDVHYGADFQIHSSHARHDREMSASVTRTRTLFFRLDFPRSGPHVGHCTCYYARDCMCANERGKDVKGVGCEGV